MDVRKILKNGVVLLDGAMGTMLQQRGLAAGERPELLSLKRPQAVEEVHRAYIEQGAQIIYANTFGAGARKLAGSGYTTEQVVSAAVAVARQAAGTGCAVALDVGPLGELLEPAGSLRFEEAYELFYEQIKCGAAAGADCIAIETMTDLYEVKAALLAAKEACSLPVLVTMTFEQDMRTFTGCTVSAMALLCEGLGADAVGFNCSLGPRELLPLARELREWTNLPMIVKANAGLPDPQTGKYHVTAQEFASAMQAFLPLGVSVLGGCCGTDPAYIACLREAVKTQPLGARPPVRRCAVCTPTNTVEVTGVHIIGERINPTGKKLFKQALKDGDMDYILAQGVAQAQAGAQILDVNVGLPEIDEPVMLQKTVRALQAVLELPLQLDSTDAKALEAGLRVYNGNPVVNSVNGERAVLERVLPLVKKYGAAVVGLTLDENGIPQTAEGRFAIAQRILEAALSYGIPREDVWIDCLTMTVSVQQEEAEKTLAAVRMVKERLGLKTVLGVSNVSFGLPNRELLNRTFLLLALENGLDLPILNPNAATMTDTIRAFEALKNRDPGAQRYTQAYAAAPAAPPAAGNIDDQALRDAVEQGLRGKARSAAQELLKTRDEMELINTVLIPALDAVGERFEKGALFLPQLLQAAGAAQEAFACIKETMLQKGAPARPRGKIVLATVKGDIHDIGKNIVKTILENYGYQIIDLGRDVPAQEVVAAVKEHDVRLAGLSALMTTTLKSMEETIEALKAQCPACRVMVGGAVLTEEYAKRIGADFYAQDARRSVEIARLALG